MKRMRSTEACGDDPLDNGKMAQTLAGLNGSELAKRRSDSDVYGLNKVERWLDSIGLGKYAPAFEVHEVVWEFLPFLSRDDLKEMGISAVGARRRMLVEISKLASQMRRS